MIQSFLLAIGLFFLILLWRLLFCCWISPTLAYWKLKKNGFGGPTPSFPLGNISDMKGKIINKSNIDSFGGSSSNIITHDIHAMAFPYFARWQKSHGKHFHLLTCMINFLVLYFKTTGRGAGYYSNVQVGMCYHHLVAASYPFWFTKKMMYINELK